MILKKKIAIYGAGGLGKEVLSLLNALSDWEVIGFYDDAEIKGTTFKGLPLLGGVDDLVAVNHSLFITIAIGDPKTKAALVKKLKANANIEFPTLIHPNAVLLEENSIRIGKGTLISAGVILTTDIEIGEHVLLNINSTIGHDVKIGSFCSLMPGVNVAGGVQVEEEVMVGSGANILNGLILGKGSRVGAGSVVTKNVESNDTVVGIPANPISRK